MNFLFVPEKSTPTKETRQIKEHQIQETSFLLIPVRMNMVLEKEKKHWTLVKLIHNNKDLKQLIRNNNRSGYFLFFAQ